MNIKESRTTRSNDRTYDVNIDIMLTTFCNINCDYCCKGINNIAAADRVHIELATFKESIEKIFSANKNLKYRITLLGGEISLHPNLEEIVKILAKYQEQISQLYFIFNGVLDFTKYIDIFPPERVIVTVSIHSRMLTANELGNVIYNINKRNKKIKSFWIDILIDPVVSEDPEFWNNFSKKIIQQTSIERVTLAPLNNVKYNDKMTDYIYSADKSSKRDDYIITDMDNNIIKASSSDIQSSGRISFKGLYCYSYNFSWQLDLDGKISKFCNYGDQTEHYEVSRYNEFFASLSVATPCPLPRCCAGSRSCTKKTINKQEVEEFYKTILNK